tara:strand:+ start:139 stop:492 length:354 start_codon:yes stop_codon:yes gene_type:complete
MPQESFKIGIEEMQQTAILKVDGRFVDFQAKEIVNIVDDLLGKDFINFILNLHSCTDLNNYGISILISLIGSIKQNGGTLFFTHLSNNQEKKLKMMGLAAYTEFFSDDNSAMDKINN